MRSPSQRVAAGRGRRGGVLTSRLGKGRPVRDAVALHRPPAQAMVATPLRRASRQRQECAVGRTQERCSPMRETCKLGVLLSPRTCCIPLPASGRSVAHPERAGPDAALDEGRGSRGAGPGDLCDRVRREGPGSRPVRLGCTGRGSSGRTVPSSPSSPQFAKAVCLDWGQAALMPGHGAGESDRLAEGPSVGEQVRRRSASSPDLTFPLRPCGATVGP